MPRPPVVGTFLLLTHVSRSSSNGDRPFPLLVAILQRIFLAACRWLLSYETRGVVGHHPDKPASMSFT